MKGHCLLSVRSQGPGDDLPSSLGCRLTTQAVVYWEGDTRELDVLIGKWISLEPCLQTAMGQTVFYCLKLSKRHSLSSVGNHCDTGIRKVEAGLSREVY